MDTASAILGHLGEVAKASHNHWIATGGLVAGVASTALHLYAVSKLFPKW